MGDISRHRDIFLNTREAIPANLLQRCSLTAGDLTYLELGNFLTDVSQFRDPVVYIFAKQRIWREFVLPKVRDRVEALRVIGALAGAASLAASHVVQELTSGIPADIAKYGGPTLAGLGGALLALPTDTYADIGGADDWIDRMFGTPLERVTGDPTKRDERHYGLVGQFFRYFLEGITHLLFAQNIQNRVAGDWGRVDRIPEASVTAVFEESFTQYYPHEHTDQPPYVWDASERPKHRRYQPSTRQRSLADPDIGLMTAVDEDYVEYLAEGLAALEQEWRALRPDDAEGRRGMLVRMGKLLHAVEDWFFHSNVVEILRVRGHRPARSAEESGEEFLQRFVRQVAREDPEFVAAELADRQEWVRLQRRLYRRLRYPAYDRGTRTESAGRLSRTRMSTLSVHHAYPAFPSQQDTSHTLLHALENLERKITQPQRRQAFQLEPWMPCVLARFVAARGGEGDTLLQEKAAARGTTRLAVLAGLSRRPVDQQAVEVAVDVLREWLPLIVTLLNESERQRLLANVQPLNWPLPEGASPPARPRVSPEFELDEQLRRHKEALQPRENEDGRTENNYERAARYLVECEFLNPAGQRAMVTAFEVDRKAQNLLKDAPGCGGFLIKFAVGDLQRALDEGDAAMKRLDQNPDSVFGQASDNGAFNEIIGSHSLMSKDTRHSAPYFDEARVLASVASSAVFHIMLEQVSTPSGERRLPWRPILHHFIRYPVAAGGWELRALEFFRNDPQRRIPRYDDLPELARLVANALASREALASRRPGTKEEELQSLYIRLEGKLSSYRYPYY